MIKRKQSWLFTENGIWQALSPVTLPVETIQHIVWIAWSKGIVSNSIFAS